MQGQSTGVGYGLKYQARCIVDVKADTDQTCFLAGTLSLKEENEVHLIRLSQDGTELVCEGLFSHPNEIWDLASCPFNSRLFSTVFASGGETYGASVWEIPEAHGQTNVPQLEEVVSLDGHTAKIKGVLWWPSGVHEKVISIDEENITLWSLDASAKSGKVLAREPTGMLHKLSGGVWDPHDQNMVAGISDSSIQFWDLHSMKKASSIEQSHVRSVDFNPRKQFILATAEDEGIHIWDLRMPSTYLKEIPGHTHWTWVVQHNPVYDNLILSAGTDSVVNLWMASVNESNESSAESLDSPTHHTDPLLNSYSDYEDSVYGIAWSHREPWIFASLSYDGRIVVESVKPYLPKT